MSDRVDAQSFNAVDPDGNLRVLGEQCRTCIFRPGNLLDLSPGAVKDVVQQALDRQTAVICHDTLGKEIQAVCRGFADKYDTTPLRVARVLGMFSEIDPPADGLEAVR